jgi:hypothetical protein
MEYLYMQKPQPTSATGVSVLLQAVKADGKVIDIGTTTSDSMGHYQYTWEPTEAGTYKILATFEGSQSYFGDSAQTGLSVTSESANTISGTGLGMNMITVLTAAVVILVILVIFNTISVRKLKK